MIAIVQRSAAFVTFVGLLGLTLSAPQRQHLERFGDLLVAAPRRKTLAQLAALEFPGVGPSNLADFFRIRPWDPDDLRCRCPRGINTHQSGGCLANVQQGKSRPEVIGGNRGWSASCS